MNQDGAKAGNSNIAPSFVRGCLLLTGVLMAVFPLFALYGNWRYGAHGIAASAVAAGVCLVAALSAFTAMVVIPYVSGILLAMLLRMAIPLVVGVILNAQKGALADANVFGFILVYYFVMLATETPLSLKLVRHAQESSPSKD